MGLADRQRFVLEIAGNKVWGGGETYIRDIVAELKTDGVPVLVATRGIEVVDDQFRKVGASLVKVPLRGFADFLSPARMVHAVLARNLANQDVTIHVHNFKELRTAARIKRRLKGKRDVRIIVTRHLAREAKTDSRHLRLYKKADAIIFVSRTALNTFMQTVAADSEADKILSPRVTVVGNALRGLTSGMPEHRLDKSPRIPLKILYAGRIAEEKGPDLLLDALSLLHDGNWTLVMAGTGEAAYIRFLQEKARKLGMEHEIIWKGYLDHLTDEIDNADFGVFPSLAKESFGLTLLEFMSRGLPVVSTDTGAQRELITDEQEGLIVPPKPDAFSEAIRRMLNDHDFRRSAAQAALETFEKHDYAAFKAQMWRHLGIRPCGKEP